MKTGYPSVDKPWLKHYAKSQIEYNLPSLSIYEYLYEQNKNHLNEDAIIYFDKKMSFEIFFNYINKFASALCEFGIKKNDVVTLCLPNIPQAVIAFYAINRMGAIADMLHPLSSGAEIKSSISDANSKILITTDMNYSKIAELTFSAPLKKIILASVSSAMPFHLKAMYSFTVEKNYEKPENTELYMSFDNFIKLGKEGYKPLEKVNPYDNAIFFRTGGTTGMPKAAVFSNDNYNSSITQIQIDNDIVLRKDRLLALMPLFHGFGSSNCVHLALCSGVTAVLLPKYTPKMFEQAVVKHKINHILAVPMVFESILNNKMFKGKNLSYFKYLICGGDRLKPSTEAKFQKFLHEHGVKEPLLKAYGLTEAIAATTRTRRNLNEPLSVGIPFVKNNFKVVKVGTQEELTYNTRGELCVSGPSIMKEYYNNTEETSQVLKQDANGVVWLHTGDIGFINEDGIIFFEQRDKHIIITNGYNVYPALIEEQIEKDLDVKQCAVVGIPHEKKGEVPIAVIVLQEPPCVTKHELTNRLQTLCKNNLPLYSTPVKFVFTTQLPLTAMNKTDYIALSQKYK